MKTKLKTEEYEIHFLFKDGAIVIKEDTDVERPVAIVPFPLDKHEGGVKKQRQYAKLLAAAPEILDKLNKLLEAVAPLDDTLLKDFYKEAVIAYAEAKKIIESLNI